MEKKISTKTFVLLFAISIGLICLGIGSSYAVFTASDEITNPIVFTGLSYDSDVIETVNVNVPAEETVSTTLNIANDSGIKLNYVVWYLDEGADIDLGTSSGSTSSSLANGSSTSVIVDIRNNSDESVTVQIGVMSDNDAIVLDSDMKTVPNEELSMKVNLVSFMNDLYSSATKTEVTNNSITYNYAKIYDTDTDENTSGGLMNDRLGSSSVGVDAGNIRYYGKTPKNYIDIGDSDSEGNVTLWRIIGLFKNVELSDGTKKDLVKIIRNESIGKYSWDQSPSDVNSGNGINEWSQADLMKLLNPEYESEEVGGSLYWNSKSGSCYGYDSTNSVYTSITCDFTNSGLNSNVHNKIEEVKWNLGGWNSKSIYSNQIYEYERLENVVQNPNDGVTRKKVWPARVALAYPSDYGYAADLDSCGETLNNYSSCTGVNWMRNSVTSNGSGYSWLLTPDSSAKWRAWYVDADGSVHHAYGVYNALRVSPVFYLDSALNIVDGEGTATNPYVLS